jgi:uncharacterized RDD family membrane protein YckC
MACWAYEGLLLVAVISIPGGLFILMSRAISPTGNNNALQAFLFVVVGIYFVWSWAKGQTLAMKTWHICIVDQEGRAISQARALRRYMYSWVWLIPPLAATAPFHLKLAEVAVFVAGWIAVWALLSRFAPQGQFWHDIWAGTRLVSSAATHR